MLKLAFLLIPMLTTALHAAEPRVRRNVEVEWEGVADASLYEVKIVRKNDSSKKPAFFKLKESKWTATIAPGTYLMQIRSYDDRGAPGDWSPASELEVRLPAIIVTEPTGTIQAREEGEQEIKLAWETVPGAERYKVTIGGEGGWKKDDETRENHLDVKVPVGKRLHWNVVAVDPRGVDGEASAEPYAFDLNGPELARPEIDRPMSKYVRELRWSAPAHATRYEYELQRRHPSTRKWETVEQKTDYADTQLPFDYTRPSGRYRLSVKAAGERRPDSPRAQMEFAAYGGFKSSEDFENAILRESIRRPSDYYLITSYLVTQISFTGKNYDDNTNGTFRAVGGTGRIGLGYQNAGEWGGFGIADLSGFVINGQNFKFASLEGHVTRRLEYGQSGVLLGGFGVFAKELPILKGSPVDGYSSTAKARNIGPHGGFTYWMPLSDRWGLQANARAYYTVLGSASTGGRAVGSLSYQYGLLGSYRLNRSWIGYTGYAFRHDESRYESNSGDRDSFAQPGQVNSVSIEGHYLNLLLEFSF